MVTSIKSLTRTQNLAAAEPAPPEVGEGFGVSSLGVREFRVEGLGVREFWV